MWSAVLKCSYFFTIFQYILTCTCTDKSSNSNAKEEIKCSPQNQKRQLEFNDYNPTEVIIEDILKGDETEISGLIFTETSLIHFKTFVEGHDMDKESILDYDNDENEISNQTSTNFNKKKLPINKKHFEIQKVNKKHNSTKEGHLKTILKYYNLTTKSPIRTIPVYRNVHMSPKNITEEDIFNENATLELNPKDPIAKLDRLDETAKTSDYSTAQFDFDTVTNEDETNISEMNYLPDIPVECKKYKKTAKFSLDNMMASWQIAYYTMSTRLKCFTIYIRGLSQQEQRHYAKVYGDFNNSVLWNRCYLEITSSDNNKIGFNRKHFLQGSDLERGVLKNILIDEERSPNMATISLQHESPDQWLVVKDILLMRDCNTGHLAVFTRIHTEPAITDIQAALKLFGELNLMNGTRACLKTDLFTKSVNNIASTIL